MASRTTTTGVKPEPVGLLLDEMFTPRIAEELLRRGHDVLAVAADPELRALSDAEICAWASDHARRVVTENVKDFRRLASTAPTSGVLFSSNRRFPRSRRNLGPLIDTLDRWLVAAATAPPPAEDWLIA